MIRFQEEGDTMLDIRRDREIYAIDGEWFQPHWHFSFDQYRDPANDSFGAMRVFNDDRLIPGAPIGLFRGSVCDGGVDAEDH